MARCRLTTESFISRAKEKHGELYDYSKTIFTESDQKLEIICRVHGSFWQKPYSHLAGHGCNSCRKTSLEDFIAKALSVHKDRYDYSEVLLDGVFTKVRIICRKHGVFEQTPAAHTRMKQGCPLCSYEKIHERHSHHKELFSEKALIVHGDKYDYSKVDYIRSRYKVEIVCKEHGSFFMTPNNHLRGESCGKCVPGGFQPNLPGCLYLLESANKFKIGITNKNPSVRATYINSTSSTEVFEVVDSILFEDGYQAQALEKLLLTNLRNLCIIETSEKFNGYTECFDLEYMHLIKPYFNNIQEIN